MPLRALTYREVTRRLDKLGFRFYRQGKGSHELWVRDRDGRVVPVPHHLRACPECSEGVLRSVGHNEV